MHWHQSNAPRWIAALSLAGRGLLVVFADVGTAGHQRPIERLLAERKRESSAASMLGREPSAHGHSVCEGAGGSGWQMRMRCVGGREFSWAAGLSCNVDFGISPQAYLRQETLAPAAFRIVSGDAEYRGTAFASSPGEYHSSV